MEKEVRIYTGGMDSDSDVRYIKNGDTRYAINCLASGGNSGSIETVKGTTLVTTELPAGQNICIGTYDDAKLNRVIYFIYNSSGNHSILEYDVKQNSITKILQHSILAFDYQFYVNGINIVDDNLLYFTDGYNPPRKINIKKAKAYSAGDYINGYGQRLTTGIIATTIQELQQTIGSEPVMIQEEYLDAAKYPPYKEPDYEFYTDPTEKTSNRVLNSAFQFKYRWIYDDNEKSAWSPVSFPILETVNALFNFSAQSETSAAYAIDDMEEGYAYPQPINFYNQLLALLPVSSYLSFNPVEAQDARWQEWIITGGTATAPLLLNAGIGGLGERTWKEIIDAVEYSRQNGNTTTADPHWNAVTYPELCSPFGQPSQQNINDPGSSNVASTIIGDYDDGTPGGLTGRSQRFVVPFDQTVGVTSSGFGLQDDGGSIGNWSGNGNIYLCNTSVQTDFDVEVDCEVNLQNLFGDPGAVIGFRKPSRFKNEIRPHIVSYMDIDGSHVVNNNAYNSLFPAQTTDNRNHLLRNACYASWGDDLYRNTPLETGWGSTDPASWPDWSYDIGFGNKASYGETSGNNFNPDVPGGFDPLAALHYAEIINGVDIFEDNLTGLYPIFGSASIGGWATITAPLEELKDGDTILYCGFFADNKHMRRLGDYPIYGVVDIFQLEFDNHIDNGGTVEWSFPPSLIFTTPDPFPLSSIGNNGLPVNWQFDGDRFTSGAEEWSISNSSINNYFTGPRLFCGHPNFTNGSYTGVSDAGTTPTTVYPTTRYLRYTNDGPGNRGCSPDFDTGHHFQQWGEFLFFSQPWGGPPVVEPGTPAPSGGFCYNPKAYPANAGIPGDIVDQFDVPPVISDVNLPAYRDTSGILTSLRISEGVQRAEGRGIYYPPDIFIRAISLFNDSYGTPSNTTLWADPTNNIDGYSLANYNNVFGPKWSDEFTAPGTLPATPAIFTPNAQGNSQVHQDHDIGGLTIRDGDPAFSDLQDNINCSEVFDAALRMRYLRHKGLVTRDPNIKLQLQVFIEHTDNASGVVTKHGIQNYSSIGQQPEAPNFSAYSFSGQVTMNTGDTLALVAEWNSYIAYCYTGYGALGHPFKTTTGSTPGRIYYMGDVHFEYNNYNVNVGPYPTGDATEYHNNYPNATGLNHNFDVMMNIGNAVMGLASLQLGDNAWSDNMAAFNPLGAMPGGSASLSPWGASASGTLTDQQIFNHWSQNELFVYKAVETGFFNFRNAQLSVENVPIGNIVQAESEKDNAIKLSVQTGSELVTDIEVAVRDMEIGASPEFYLIESIDKNELALNDFSLYTIIFKNQQRIKDVLDLAESNRLYDFMPKVAKAQEYLSNNRIAYGNILEGYDNCNKSKTIGEHLDVSLHQNYCPIVYQHGAVAPGNTNVHESTVISDTGGLDLGLPAESNYFHFGFNFGDLTTPNVVRLQAIYPDYAAPPLTIVPLGTLTTGPGAQPANLPWVTVYGGNSANNQSGNAVPNFGGDIHQPCGYVNENEAVLKRGAKYTYGLVYFDRAGRASMVNSNKDMIVETPWYHEANLPWFDEKQFTPMINVYNFYAALTPTQGEAFHERVLEGRNNLPPNLAWEINHQPPVWATHYQWVRTKEETLGYYIQGVTGGNRTHADDAIENEQFIFVRHNDIDNYAGDLNGQTFNQLLNNAGTVDDIAYMAINVTNFILHDDKTDDGKNNTVMNYSFKKGDKIRFKGYLQYPDAQSDGIVNAGPYRATRGYGEALYQEYIEFDIQDLINVNLAGQLNNESQWYLKVTGDFSILKKEISYYGPPESTTYTDPQSSEDRYQAFVNNTTFEIYRIKESLPDSDKIFYEFGETFRIGHPHSDDRFHMGEVQDQNTGVQPARGLFGAKYTVRQDVYNSTGTGVRGVTCETTRSHGDMYIRPRVHAVEHFAYDNAGTHYIPQINMAGNVLYATLGGDNIYTAGSSSAYPSSPELADHFLEGIAHIQDGIIIEDPHIYDYVPKDQYTRSVGRPHFRNDKSGEVWRWGTVRFSDINVEDTSTRQLNVFYESTSALLGITSGFVDYEKDYGAIQKLVSRESDLILLHENKTNKAMVGKDIFSSPTGSGEVAVSSNALSEGVPFLGDFGVGLNPESVAVYNNVIYYVDVRKGSVIRLSRDGITQISENQMHNYFNDKSKSLIMSGGTFKVHGVYNREYNEYIVTFENPVLTTSGSAPGPGPANASYSLPVPYHVDGTTESWNEMIENESQNY